MAKEESKKTYVLKDGMHHYVRDEDGVLVQKTGPDVVELTEREFRSFQDKFMDADAENERFQKMLKLQESMAKAKEANGSAAGAANTPGIPQDDSAKHPQIPVPAGVQSPAVPGNAPRPPMAPTSAADTHKAPGTSPSENQAKK